MFRWGIGVTVNPFDRFKTFLKQFVLLDDVQGSTTGFLSYASVLELLERDIAKSERYSFPVSLLILDIEHNQKRADFLEIVQSIAKSSIRETDVFGAYESDGSFICVLPHTKFDAAYDLAERLRMKLARRLSLAPDADVRFFDIETTEITEATEFDMDESLVVSCGVCELEQFESAEELVARAVEALDMATSKNGNCTMPKPVIKDVVVADLSKHLN